jgi:hypothetical protein
MSPAVDVIPPAPNVAQLAGAWVPSSPLSSDAVFRRYARLVGSSLRVPPHFVRVRLGYLTLPVGHGYPDTAHHELAWAYTGHQCSDSMNPSVTTAPVRLCVSWLFLDAANGLQIDETQQH